MADKYLNRLKVMLVEKSAMSNYRPKNSTKAQQPLVYGLRKNHSHRWKCLCK